ncbi:NmrA-like family protein [Trichoderma afarasin]
MSGKIETVIVLGGSGSLGTLLVLALVNAGFKVSAAVRQSSAATYPKSVTVHKTDYSKDSLVSVFQRQDAVVSCIPRAQVADQKTVVDACVSAGVKRFLPSEYGGDTTLPDIEKRISFTAGKKEFGEYLVGKESEGLTWTRVFTGPFFDWMLTQSARQFKLDMGVMGWDLESFKVTIFDSGDQEFSCTNTKTVAEAIASVLKREDATKNQNVYVSSFPRLTQNEVLAALEGLSGRKFEVTHASTEDLVAKGEARIKRREWLQGYIETVSASCYAPWGYNTFGDRAEKWNTILELPKEDLEDTLTRVLRMSDTV